MNRLGEESVVVERKQETVTILAMTLDPASDFTLLDLSFIGKYSIFF